VDAQASFAIDRSGGVEALFVGSHMPRSCEKNFDRKKTAFLIKKFTLDTQNVCSRCVSQNIVKIKYAIATVARVAY